MKKHLLTIGAFAVLVPALAYAHPQHADASFSGGFLHPLAGLDHLAAMFAVGVWAARMGGRAAWAMPSAFLAALTAGWLACQGGLAVPALEPMVAATVLILGLCVLCDARVRTLWGAALVAAFAFFHGAAHVEDAHSGVLLTSYWAGFTSATLLLHVAGIAAAWTLRHRATLLRIGAAPIVLAGAWLLVARSI
jgi:urease accessory protein